MTSRHFCAPPSGQRFSALTVRAQVLVVMGTGRWMSSTEVGDASGLSRNAAARALGLLYRDRVVMKSDNGVSVQWRISVTGQKALACLRRELQAASGYGVNHGDN